MHRLPRDLELLLPRESVAPCDGQHLEEAAQVVHVLDDGPRLVVAGFAAAGHGAGEGGGSGREAHHFACEIEHAVEVVFLGEGDGRGFGLGRLLLLLLGRCGASVGHDFVLWCGYPLAGEVFEDGVELVVGDEGLGSEVVGEGEGLDELLEAHEGAGVPVAVDALDLWGDDGKELGDFDEAGVDFGLDIGGKLALDFAYAGGVSDLYELL